uniref:Uncharacterized protein n=1 Tax=Cyprinus carpio carpio TaxID=630221 RepID=A0A9J8B6R8_CYPCA
MVLIYRFWSPLLILYNNTELSDYLTCNDNGEVSPCTLWDAAKAVMRSKLIMWASQKKKKNRVCQNRACFKSLPNKLMI